MLLVWLGGGCGVSVGVGVGVGVGVMRKGAFLEALHEGFEARNFILIPKDMSEARR